MNFLDKHKENIENAIGYYFSEDEQKKYFNTVPKSRYCTFKHCYENLKPNPVIVELGTSRSFVDGRFEGCNSDDEKYWEPFNSEKWDWSAGCFTKVFSNLFLDSEFHTVDICKNHINRCKIMNNDNANITYHISSSEDFLNSFTNHKIDLLYLDTGDMTPIEDTAQLHLREAKIIIEKDLINDNGLILIDDVKSCVPKQFGELSNLGKAKYSIPFFLENGYEIVMDEYQCILKKI